MREFLFDGSDASGVSALDDILDFLGKFEASLFDDLACFDDVDGDVVIDESEDVEIEGIDIAFYFQDVFFAHDLGTGIFNNSYGAVHFVESKVLVDTHGFSGLDMVKDEAFFNLAYV